MKLRGNAQQLNEKYLALAHDAAAAGERITAEAYTQFADHYFRLHQAAVDAAEERRVQHAERQSRADAPQPTIDDEPAENGNAASRTGDASDSAEPAQAKPSHAKPSPAKPSRGRAGRAKAGEANVNAGDVTDAGSDETDSGKAEVVDLSPAKLSEMVQEEQDSASA